MMSHETLYVYPESLFSVELVFFIQIASLTFLGQEFASKVNDVCVKRSCHPMLRLGLYS